MATNTTTTMKQTQHIHDNNINNTNNNNNSHTHIHLHSNHNNTSVVENPLEKIGDKIIKKHHFSSLSSSSPSPIPGPGPTPSSSSLSSSSSSSSSSLSPISSPAVPQRPASPAPSASPTSSYHSLLSPSSSAQTIQIPHPPPALLVSTRSFSTSSSPSKASQRRQNYFWSKKGSSAFSRALRSTVSSANLANSKPGSITPTTPTYQSTKLAGSNLTCLEPIQFDKPPSASTIAPAKRRKEVNPAPLTHDSSFSNYTFHSNSNSISPSSTNSTSATSFTACSTPASPAFPPYPASIASSDTLFQPHCLSPLVQQHPLRRTSSLPSLQSCSSSNLQPSFSSSASSSRSSVISLSSAFRTSCADSDSTMASTTLIGAPLAASNNVPSESSSLFQIAATIKDRLEDVPGISNFLEMCISGNIPNSATPIALHHPHSQSSPNIVDSHLDSTDTQPSTLMERSSSTLTLSTSAFVPLGKRVDPVTHLWQFFRLGSSLCTLFNALQPRTPLNVVITSDVKTCKRSVYDFVQGCKSELDYSDDELFTISNVFSDNTTDLLKVIRTVKLLLDTLEAKNFLVPSKKISLAPPPAPGPKDKRDKVVEELLVTERKYVHDLELLLEYQTELQTTGALSADTIHYLFPNLNVLIDFQRRFLIGIEYHARLPPKEQFIGSVFINFEEGFEVYEGFALNQKKACQIAVAEASKLSSLSHIVDPTYELPCFLIKPIQRICKYPLLLRELVKYTPEDWPNYQNQVEALEAIKRVTFNVNETQRRVENLGVVKQLSELLIDWKGHNLNDFGALLHDGVFPVIKSGAEREYHLYLFENIILCCKESPPPKKSMTLSSKKSKPKRSSLILKGRIYMAFITHISSSIKNGYLLHLAWGKDASDSGFFDIKFRNDELLDQWESTINQMVSRYNDPAVDPLDSTLSFTDSTLVNGTSYDEVSDDETYDMTHHQPSSSTSNNSREALHDDDSTSTSISHDISYPIDPSSLDKTYPFAYQQQLSSLSDDLNTNRGIPLHASPAPSSSSSSINNTVMGPRQESSKSVSSFSAVSSAAHYNVRVRSASVPVKISDTLYSNSSNVSAPPIPPMPAGLASNSNSTTTSSTDLSAEPVIKNSNLTEIPPPSIRSIPQEEAPAVVVPPKRSNMKVKLHYLQDTFLIIVPSDASYAVLLERVERKVRLCGNQTPTPLRIKYKDEDDDFVTMHSDEDIQMALEPLRQLTNTDDKPSKTQPDLTIWAA